MDEKKELIVSSFFVPRTGIEPARLAAHAPETCASTYSATWAFRKKRCAKITLFFESRRFFEDIFRKNAYLQKNLY